MKYFATGFGIGSLLGIGISFLYDPESNQRVKDDVKDWLIGVKTDSTQLSEGIKDTKANVADLTDQLPQTVKTLSSIEKSLKKFQVSIKPNIQKIKSELKQIDQTIGDLDKF